MEKSKGTYRRYQLCSVIGSCLLLLPNGIRWLWGNLTVYTSSYMYAQGGHDAQDINIPWVLSIYTLAWTFGLFVSGPMMKVLDIGLTQFIGVILINTGLLSSYFAVRYNSIWGLNLTIGAIPGVGNGIVKATIILILAERFTKHTGLAISVVLSSRTLGSVLTNQLATWYINPENLIPTLKVSHSTFFMQKSVYEKAPSFFLILGLISALTQFIGFLLVCYQKMESMFKRSSLACFHEKVGESSSVTKRGDLFNHTLNDNNIDQQDAVTVQTDLYEDDKNVGLTPQQVLRTFTFYIIWFGYAGANISREWLFNYYKIFGFHYFSDDQIMTDLGTAMAVIVAILRSMWGWSADHLGIKKTIVTCSMTITLVLAFYFFTPMANQILFGLWTIIYVFSCSGYSTLMIIITLRLYGKSHYSANYAMMNTTSIVVNIIAPFYFQGFLKLWGWFALLITMSGINGLATIMQLLLIPDNS